MMQRPFAQAIVLSVALSLLAASSSGSGPATALDQHGRGHVVEGPSGRLTLLEFAASWCAPCRTTLPRLAAFARQHPELRVLAVSVDERRAARDELVAALDLDLPLLWDEGHRIAELYQPEAMPAALLISADGKVLHRALGSRTDDWDALVRRVEEELRRASGTVSRPARPQPR